MCKHVSTETCIAAGIDPKKLEALCHKLEKVTKELKDMGISIFGASGDPNLVVEKHPSNYYVVADNFSISADGGDSHFYQTEDNVWILDIN